MYFQNFGLADFVFFIIYIDSANTSHMKVKSLLFEFLFSSILLKKVRSITCYRLPDLMCGMPFALDICSCHYVFRIEEEHLFSK